MTLTIGLDLGDKWSQMCTLDESGLVIEEARVPTSQEALKRRFQGLEPALVALEAGTHSTWVRHVLEDCGHRALVANARKLRLISRNDKKSDRVDAEWLARLARVEPKLLAPIKHRSRQAQLDLAMLRSRTSLVRVRTQLINHTRGVVKSSGARLRNCSTAAFHKQAPSQIPSELRPALTTVITAIGSLTRKIHRFDKSIAEMAAERYPEVSLLQQIAGVGTLTSTTFVLTIDDPHRFKSSRSIGAYLGLRPRRRQSGDRDPQLRIAKSGDSELRSLLVTAAHYILGPFAPDSSLRRWGLSFVKEGDRNSKKRAIVAVARKLAVLLHHLWITAEVYEPLRTANNRRRQLEAAS